MPHGGAPRTLPAASVDWRPLPLFLGLSSSILWAPIIAAGSILKRTSLACAQPSAPYSTLASARQPCSSRPACRTSAGASKCTSPSTWALRSTPTPNAAKYIITTPSHQPMSRRGMPTSRETGFPFFSREPPFSVRMTSAAFFAESKRRTPRLHAGRPSLGGCILRPLPPPSLTRRCTSTSARFPYHSKRSRNSASLHCKGTGCTQTTQSSLRASPPGGPCRDAASGRDGAWLLLLEGPASRGSGPTGLTCQARSWPSGRR
mmetsp:Transcript_25590/g.76312  ORF Transcript_25590/g.76312 Transcript_25590/m.76312 type:complete len:261 (+) Transcript_25590:486-1268(+)